MVRTLTIYYIYLLGQKHTIRKQVMNSKTAKITFVSYNWVSFALQTSNIKASVEIFINIKFVSELFICIPLLPEFSEIFGAMMILTRLKFTKVPIKDKARGNHQSSWYHLGQPSIDTKPGE